MRISKNILIAAPLLVALGAVYFFLDPAQSSLFPRCLFHEFTGWKCPGCGAQRLVHALLHGDIAAAMRHNAFLLFAIAVIAVMVIVELRRDKWPRAHNFFTSGLFVGIILALALVWTVVRNVLGL